MATKEQSGSTKSIPGGSTTQATQLLKCPLCENDYNSSKHEAKLLACHHSMCLKCLEKLKADKDHIKCPLCRKKTPLPKKGVKKLQTNFYVAQMLDIVSSVSPPGVDDVTAPMATSPPTTSQVEINMNVTETCSKHNSQPLLFFCETCSQPICMNCTVLDHDKNQGHVIKDVAAVLPAYMSVIQSKLSGLDKAIKHKQGMLLQLKHEMANLDTAKHVAMERLEEMFGQLRSKLEERQKSLQEKIQDQHTEKREDIVKNAQLVKSEISKLHNVSEKFVEMTSSQSAIPILQTACDLKSMAALDQMVSRSTNQSSDTGFIEYKYNSGLKSYLDALGKLGEVKSDRPLPADIHIRIPDTTACIPTTIDLCVRGGGTNSYLSAPAYNIGAEITTPSGDTIKCKMQATEAGTFTIPFLPQNAGKHQLSVSFLGQALPDGQVTFTVQSNNPVFKFGSEGSKAGQMYHPTSVKINASGDIYVVDMGNKRIQIFSKDGVYKSEFTVGASKTTTYDIAIHETTEEIYCVKVAADESGRMLADTVRILGMDGTKKRQFFAKGNSNALFLAVNSKGHIILSDAAEHHLSIFSKEGTLVKRIGSHGNKKAEFHFPAAIAIGKNDEIFVNDTKNHRVQVFSSDGNFLHMFGSHGDGNGQFVAPRGLATDHHGNVLVADSHKRIQVFRYDGTFVASIGSEGDAIQEPYNMVTTGDGHVLVSDFKAACVRKYRYV